MNLLGKTALGLLAAAGLMSVTTPTAEARDHHRHYHGRDVVVVRSYPHYYYRRPVVYSNYYYGDPYYYSTPYYGYYGSGPGFSVAFGGHGYRNYHHWHR